MQKDVVFNYVHQTAPTAHACKECVKEVRHTVLKISLTVNRYRMIISATVYYTTAWDNYET